MPHDLPSSTHPIETALANAWPARRWRDIHIVLAVSGGADSVGMLRAMIRLKEAAGGAGRLYVGHFNHGIRPDAGADANWLVELCRKFTVPVEVGYAEVDSLASAAGDGWEAAAREARYRFLGELAERVGARYVAVAHTANDQAETVLHRIIRGSGLAGLGGIPFSRPLSPVVSIIRPLLKVKREHIRKYLAALQQDFREDVSNREVRFLRNRLRHELLPHLRSDYNPEIDHALLRLSAQAKEAQEVVADLGAELLARCVEFDFGGNGSNRRANEARFACEPLSLQARIVIREMLKLAWTRAGWPLQSMGYDEWEILADLALQEECVAQHNLPGNVRASRTKGIVSLRRNAALPHRDGD